MIYLDSSALVKLALDEAESAELNDFALSYSTKITSDLSIAEVQRAVRRNQRDLLGRAEIVLSRISTISIGRDVLRSAGLLEPVTLRTSDAIHLASALTIRDELEAFVAYDKRLLEAARAFGFPIASPGL